jgi:Flp pilus assembly protein TadG
VTRINRSLRSSDGGQLVEFALVLPILLMILTAIMEFGFMLRTNSVSAAAAREGARMAVIPGAEEDNYLMVRSRVNTALAEGNLDPGRANITIVAENVTIAPNTVAAGVRVNVAYTYTTMFLGPIFAIINGSFAQSIVIQTTAVMRTQIAAVEPAT